VDALEQMTACIAGAGAGVISSWGNNGHIEPGIQIIYIFIFFPYALLA
jgi:hypothetical protein